MTPTISSPPWQNFLGNYEFGKRDLQSVTCQPPFLNHALSMSGSRGRRVAIRFYTTRAVREGKVGQKRWQPPNIGNVGTLYYAII